ncbi:hemerythrin-like, metal-binding domain protein [Candidatus Magnetobacterium bavaricum]|uniref:Hemerythrin-like, metal-binding domain protein n=1 Tax=Candidatus Magnetobacterium bavaricum TaxID=29290 RepID=A0A0F3GXP5_9BACT|nr:hemerythrin-like, metal-binding domain protein [Candidatus Magnetobacterium bavaricum]
MNDLKFGWNEQLRTGNDIMDIQHKELISKIIYLMEEIKNNNSRAVVSVIAYLTDYVFEHFTLEERLMLKTNYPEFEVHRDEHSHYVKYVFHLRQNLLITPGLLDDVLKNLALWFADHVLKTDKKMAEHLKRFVQGY